jgi:glycosyltransferase involved in cell wall biosynthesis
MKDNLLVSIIIPVKNSGTVLENCLKSIKNQTYKNIEIIIVDCNSNDNTEQICSSYSAKIFQFDNSFLDGRFDATYKRNFGVEKSNGDFVYYLDADFELQPNVIKEAVEVCTKKGFDAVIVKEVIKGDGFWTKCRHLEQESYWGDDNVEAPRFFKKPVWKLLNGLDASLGAGCDDWDLYQRLLKKGFHVDRIGSFLYHNEGKITLRHTWKKAFLYGRDVSKFVKKNPRGGLLYFFPIRPAYMRHWKLFITNPHLGIGLIFLRFFEYFGGGLGIINSKFSKIK